MFDRSAFFRAFARARDEGRRIELLIEAPGDELPQLVDECWRTGDNGEREALLKALPRLSAPERFVPVAVSACRTHVLPIFCAIACENPYPAAHFPELNFNQMVLKALFLEVAVDRIVGLTGRATSELARMAEAYASERRAAGRPVSADCERIATWRDP
jgi:hypothetical protein